MSFDEQVFLLQKHGGISRYVCEVAQALNDLPDVDAEVVAPLHYNDHLADISGSSVAYGMRVPKIPKTYRSVFAISKGLACRRFKHQRTDVIHETYFAHDVCEVPGAKRCLTVYDMTHELFAGSWPGADKTTAAKRAAVERADHVICISENTRTDLQRIFGVAEQKTSTILLGYAPRLQALAAIAAPDITAGRPYILFVGPRGGYKNFAGLLRALARSKNIVETYALVAFGGGALTQPELQLIDELSLPLDFVVHAAGDDAMMATLYRHASLFVYPSKYEGFGIPPLEAMSVGCPVACSETSSIPEVVGQAGGYFDPDDADSIHDTVSTLLNSEETRAQYIERGYAQCERFSWRNCAVQTRAAYEAIL